MHDKCFPECTNSPVSKNIPQVFPVPHAPRSYILMSQPWLVTGLDGKNQPKALNSMAPEQRRRSSRSNFRPLPQHNLQPSEVNSPGHLSLIVTCIQFTEIPLPPPPRDAYHRSTQAGCLAFDLEPRTSTKSFSGPQPESPLTMWTQAQDRLLTSNVGRPRAPLRKQ